MISSFIIPSIVLVVIIYGYKKNINIYEEFLKGVKEGVDVCLRLFPTMFAIILSIDILVKSNIISNFSVLLRPIFDFLKFPHELFMLAIMRPISGSASLGLLNDLLKNYGPDSYIGRIGSVIQGSTDTTIYIISLYFSSIGIKNIKYSLIIGLLADLMAVVLSVIVINMMFY